MDIVLKNVCKSFEERMVIRNLSHVFPAGRITCITGKSGIGKTTLLRILMGLETPDSGTIIGINDLRISAVFQEDRLCEALSASANAAIALKKGISRQKSDEILSALGLSQDLFKSVSEMSGGMRRRVSIARALAADYDLLLLDEPFTGLDADSRNLTADCILHYAHDKTVILITHDPEIPVMLNCNVLNLDSNL